MVTESEFSLVGSQKQIVLCVRKCNMCHGSEVRSGGARLDAFAGKSEGFHVATLIEISAGTYPEPTLNPSPRLSPRLFTDIRY